MAVGYVLITTESGKESGIYKVLKKLKSVKDAHPLFGEYDIIVQLEAKDIMAIGEIVTKDIKPVPGVLVTKTLTGINF